jgi:ABC-type Fe3+/spermidine/putrescine transport system ATPase subunit
VSEAAVVSLHQVSRRFGGVVAVDRVSLDVGAGEFFALLSPSGCGKTTTLRLIAGFEDPEPDGGMIRMSGEVVNGRRPYQRPIGMVFQNYALFPHLSVGANVAFGLEERRVAQAAVRERVARALELVRLDPAVYSGRRPSELSGGQRQRVALARALVLEPQILLLDEPLGALDLQLRKEMQLELRALNRSLGITFILVTHDQEEALAMSDRVAVMSAGRVLQVGAPAEVYERPRTAFVARFIGEANLFTGNVRCVADGIATIDAAGGACWEVLVREPIAPGDPVQVAVRPEWMAVHDAGAPPTGANALPGTVREIIFRGEALHVLVALTSGGVARVALRNPGVLAAPPPWQPGQPVLVSWPPAAAQVLEG